MHFPCRWLGEGGGAGDHGACARKISCDDADDKVHGCDVTKMTTRDGGGVFVGPRRIRPARLRTYTTLFHSPPAGTHKA